MRTAVVVFTRDLRVDDHPALSAAVGAADTVVPLFVFDDAILGSSFNAPNRTGFLRECLVELDAALRALGGALVVRRGDWVDTVMATIRATGAGRLYLSHDVSGFAQRRTARLRAAAAAAGCPVETTPGITVVPPGALRPAGDDHYKVFTPYWRRWAATETRPLAPSPTRIRLPEGLDPGRLPPLADLVIGTRSPACAPGGSVAAHGLLDTWVEGGPDHGIARYGERHDDLPGDATSRLSPHLHFGSVSALQVAVASAGRPGSEPFLRQLCWRDFTAQLLSARPAAAWSDYRSRGDRWRDDDAALAAWKAGRTGFPVVDAGMRQLAREGSMHNRARMVVASFLTKDLYLDWRHGARHFLDLLLDGDIANNNVNWQWMAGTGTDTNPHRVFNPTVQGARFDPDGEYVRRYVPELAALRGKAVHDPDPAVRRAYSYPAPIVDHHEAIAEYKARRV